MTGRRANLDNVIGIGENLIKEDHFASDDIQSRIDEVLREWNNISDLAKKRRERLAEVEALYQVR